MRTSIVRIVLSPLLLCSLAAATVSLWPVAALAADAPPAFTSPPTIQGDATPIPEQAAKYLRKRKPFTGCNAGHTFFHADPFGHASICKIGREPHIPLMQDGIEGLKRLGGFPANHAAPPLRDRRQSLTGPGMRELPRFAFIQPHSFNLQCNRVFDVDEDIRLECGSELLECPLCRRGDLKHVQLSNRVAFASSPAICVWFGSSNFAQ